MRGNLRIIILVRLMGIMIPGKTGKQGNNKPAAADDKATKRDRLRLVGTDSLIGWSSSLSRHGYTAWLELDELSIGLA